MKKSKTLFISLVGVASALAVAAPTVVSCKTTSKQVDEDPYTVKYTTVTFCAPDESVTIKGTAVVKARVGRQFATVMQPIAIKENAKFLYWTLDLTPAIPEELEWDDLITEDMKVYPVFEDQILLANCVGISAIETTKIDLVTGTSVPDLHYTENYGKDGWPAFPAEGITLEPGQNIFLRGNNPDGFSWSNANYSHLTFTGAVDPAPAINISGNIMGLINNGTGINSDTIPNNYCFYHLLENNPAIKYVSDTFLPATVLTENCYDGLFYGCTSILTAPYLPATTLSPTNSQNYCYHQLFYGCSSLNMIRLAYTGTSNPCFTDWVEGVAPIGEIVYDGISTTGIVPTGWTKEETTTEISIDCTDLMYQQAIKAGDQYVFTMHHPYQLKATPKHVDSEQSNAPSPHISWYSSDTRIATVNPDSGVVTGLRVGNVDIYAQATDGTGVKESFPMSFKDITLSKTAYVEAVTATSVSWDYVGAGSLPQFSYSLNDGVSWQRMQPSVSVDVPAGKRLYIKGDNINGFVPEEATFGSSYAHFAFDDDSQVNIGGNIMGLLDDCRGELTALEELSDDSNYMFCFNSLFKDEVAIREVATNFLPMTTLSEGCYYDMFNGCNNLSQAPNLPSIKLQAYCYADMFWDCWELETPPTLPQPGTGQSITLAEYCFQAMFYDCHGLKTTPELYATNAAEGCYSYMFQYCWNVTTIGKIHLTNLAKYCCQQTFCFKDDKREKTAKVEFGTGGSYANKPIWAIPYVTLPTKALEGMFDWATPSRGYTYGYIVVS